MSPDLWVPGVVVLALGAAVGWWITRRKARAGASRKQSAAPAASGSDLELEDLRQRRDELYARLRAEDLDEVEKRSLELEAAKILQRLDAAETGAPSPADDSRAAPAAPASRARSLLTGFAFGGGTAALVAVLVFWAGRDATERPPEPGGAQPTAEQPHPVAELAPEVQAEVEELLARLQATPDDLAARKRLALLYLGSDQFVPAFEQAEAVLAKAPDDIDSLYVQGVVRMTMGQDDMALAQLDRVLELFPEHVRAMTVKGLVFARRGERDEAASLWNRALEVGGPQPQIENLLAMLAAEESGELPPGHPPAEAGAQAGPLGAPPGVRPVTAPGEYRARVEADVIEGFPQTGTLFVALRPGPGGPPVAVKRINGPAFPMLVTIGPGDMMMAEGGELPESGVLTVRLDQDGSASTRGENDLEGSAEMSRGDLVTLVLR